MKRVPLAHVVGWMCASLALPVAAGAQGIRPRALLVYYGFPSSINQTWSVPAAAQEFGRYDYVLWGDGLNNPGHPDHVSAAAIAAHVYTAHTRFYGYVDLGVHTQNLPMSEIQASITRWHEMGLDGVHFDNFGYDYGTTRARQNAAVDFAHSLGLPVIVNAFRPNDAFAAVVDPVHNPSGTATRLGPSDFYFYESHGVRLGQFEPGAEWQQRADALEALRQGLGFRVLSTTTSGTDDAGAYDEPAFFYAWHASLLYGHEATGWGEYGYSAHGASNGRAPFRARPTFFPGSMFVGPVQDSGSLHRRDTDGGRIEVNSATHAYDFSPSSTDVPGSGGSTGGTLGAFPNPSRGPTRFGFTLAQPRGVSLSVLDASGRRVATIFSGPLSAGRHQPSWPGLDDAGGRVAPGSYFVVLESGGARSVARFVVER